jgi:hypothetical protein
VDTLSFSDGDWVFTFYSTNTNNVPTMKYVAVGFSGGVVVEVFHGRFQ